MIGLGQSEMLAFKALKLGFVVARCGIDRFVVDMTALVETGLTFRILGGQLSSSRCKCNYLDPSETTIE